MGTLKRTWVVFVIAVVTLLTVLTVNRYLLVPAKKSVTQTRYILGTLVTITAFGNNAGNAIELAFDRMQEIERLVTLADRSEITDLNSGKTEKNGLSPDTVNILRASIDYWQQSEGAFDVTVGPLVKVWGFDYAGVGRLPASAEIETALKKVGSQYLNLNTDSRTAWLSRPGMSVDLGGVAKGYAIEEAAKILARHGIRNALIDGGKSSMKVLGSGPRGKGWRIGVADPRNPDRLVGILVLRPGQAISTSSDSQRFFLMEGRRYAHIINPRTGYPAEGLSLVSVITTNAMEADILSTAFFVKGMDWSLNYLQRRKGFDAIFIDAGGAVRTTDGLEIETDG